MRPSSGILSGKTIRQQLQIRALKHPNGVYKHSGRKLTPEQVRRIREVYKPRDRRYGGGALAYRYKVDRKTIRNIIRGYLYKDVR